MWGVVEKKEGRVTIRQRNKGMSSTSKTDNKGEWKFKDVPQDSIIESPSMPGVLWIEENYGVLLNDPPELLPWNRAYRRLQKEKSSRLLRKGNLISASGSFAGVWRVVGLTLNTKLGILLDLRKPTSVGSTSKQPHISRDNVSLRSLIKSGIQILPSKLTGCPITL
jgi:hypothetical protein